MPAAILKPELMGLVAERFKALAEPARLSILNALRGGELSVTGLTEATGLAQANVSKHLQLLHSFAFVERRKDGLFVYYRLADPRVFEMCDLMCGRIEEEIRSRGELFAIAGDG
jgi:DNA-binding transcriptional ArsR family regulator